MELLADDFFDDRDDDTELCTMPGCFRREERTDLSDQGFCVFCAKTPCHCRGCGATVQMQYLNDEGQCEKCAPPATVRA